MKKQEKNTFNEYYFKTFTRTLISVVWWKNALPVIILPYHKFKKCWSHPIMNLIYFYCHLSRKQMYKIFWKLLVKRRFFVSNNHNSPYPPPSSPLPPTPPPPPPSKSSMPLSSLASDFQIRKTTRFLFCYLSTRSISSTPHPFPSLDSPHATNLLDIWIQMLKKKFIPLHTQIL